MRSVGSPAAARIAFHSLSTFAGPPQGDANTHGQLLRRCPAASTARAGDASQIVRGPVLASGSIARSPWTCSHLSRSASDVRAPPLGNTQDTPGNGVGFGSWKGRKRRAQ